jgi:hypothetical protein
VALFPQIREGAAKEVPHRWQLAVSLEDQEQHCGEYLRRIDPPDEPS